MRFLPNKLRQMALAVCCIGSVISSPALGQNVDLYELNFNSSQSLTDIPSLSGALRGSNGFIVDFSGTFNGNVVSNFVGAYSGTGGQPSRYAGTYSTVGGGTTAVLDPNVPVSFTFDSAGKSYSFSTTSITGSAPNYVWAFGVQQTAGSPPKIGGLQTYDVVSAPEIDGSVLSRALLISLGLMWLILRARPVGLQV